MSHAAVDTTSNSGPGRGRGTSRGRPGRGRGRGRGSFRFPGSKSLDNNDPSASSPEHSGATTAPQGQSSDGDAKRKHVRKADGRRGSTNAAAPETTADSSAPRSVVREKELPPHIAGAAVDAESLVSRVRELAISGHAHTSSVESRFTMSLNWADEEDDPDSLPDLDDWAPKPKTPLPEPVVPQEPKPEAVLHDTSKSADAQPPPEAPTQATVEELVPVVAEVTSKSPKDDSTETSAAPDARISTVTKRPRAGLEASIWASPTPEETSYIPPPPKERRSRQNNSRGSASISRLSDLPYHPLNLSRGSELSGAIHTKSEEWARQPEPRPSPRKPHARPVISTDAISRLSRTLGRDALCTQQPTTT
jgi:hypothetical protein